MVPVRKIATTSVKGDRKCKSFYSSLRFWLRSPRPAGAAQHKDVLLAVMDNGSGEKTVHTQMAQHESCVSLIANLKKRQKEDQKNTIDFY